MKILRIDVGNDFSEVPSGRYDEDGPYNGSAFRDRLLVPALRQADRVEVDLDGTEGFGSSFLEEAFGGLIRVAGFDKTEIDQKLVLIAGEDRTVRYKRKILQYIEKAAAPKRGS